MNWAKVAVVLGSLLIAFSFWLRTETTISTTVAGQTYDCAGPITSGPVSDQPTGQEHGTDSRTAAERRLDARVQAGCDSLGQRAQIAYWIDLGLGALILLVGWTVLREREYEREHEQPVEAQSALGG